MDGDYVLLTGSKDCSVILISGVLTNDNGNYTFEGYKNYFIDSVRQVSLTYGKLSLELIPKSGKTVTYTGVYAQQGDDTKLPYGTERTSSRGSGAHWFASNIAQSYLSPDYIVLHEIHQQKNNNDSWECTMIGSTEIISIQILVVGYVE